MPRHHRIRATQALLTHAASRAGVPLSIVGDDVQMGGKAYRIRVQSAPMVPQRILDLIKVHVTDVERDLARRPVIGRQTDDHPSRECLVVVVPRLPAGLTLGRHLEGLKAETAWREAAWVIVSEQGGTFISLPQQVRMPSASDEPSPAVALAMRNDPLRSDAVLAFLSVLLLRQARRQVWQHPLAHVSSVAGLVEALHVSRSALYKAITELEERRWISTHHGRMPELIDIPGVVNWFLDHAKHRRAPRQAVQPMYTTWSTRRDPLAWLSSLTVDPATSPSGESPTMAVTGWEACRLHDLAILTDPHTKPIELVVRQPLQAVMARHQLRSAAQETPSTLVLVRASKPWSTFSGVTKRKGLPIVDPWQAALQVAGDPQRGIEQATAITDALWIAP